MSVLPEIREKLNEEIKVGVMMMDSYPDSDWFKGRLNGLLWVRDRLLYDMKED